MGSSTPTIAKMLIVCAVSLIGLGAASAKTITDNAALLYYQAFLQCPEPDVETRLAINSVAHGSEPHQLVRTHVNRQDCREAISLALEATQTPTCNWGIDRVNHRSSLVTSLRQVHDLAVLLTVDARIIALDGNADDALKRGLSLRRLAGHVADEGNDGYLFSVETEQGAFSCIRYILSALSLDASTYRWLAGQLGGVQGAPASFGEATEISLADAKESLGAKPSPLADWRRDVARMVQDPSLRQELLSLTDEQIVQRAKDSYGAYLASVNWVIGSEMSYEQKYAKVVTLDNDLMNQVNAWQPVRILQSFMPLDLATYYDMHTTCTAAFNALRTAIEIYLIQAETGRLPQTLPPNMPKDPFSGQDFEYQVTGEGFVLRCQGEDIREHKIWQYEFKIEGGKNGVTSY